MTNFNFHSEQFDITLDILTSIRKISVSNLDQDTTHHEPKWFVRFLQDSDTNVGTIT